MLPSGSRLGPYEIVSPIGAGGMGEVFKARDTRLERSVAIKILPAEFAKDAQLRLRFEREAKTISSLNHPNICTLYDVGHENGTDFLVMELIEGESLADRLSKGPLPLDQVLRYGAQIAEGLDRAHKAGIVHRDLKPGNIMLTKSGAKLLDFGLAKSSAAPPAAAAFSGATEHKPLTREGTILGTFQYMAPEQLEGEEADPRTDIFALGAVLYEMATGQRAFEGKTKTSLIAAIVSSQPKPITHVQPLTPPAFEHVVAKCLEKDPDRRWQSAFDVAEELRWTAEAPATSVQRVRRRRWLVPALAALVIVTALVTWVAARRFFRVKPAVVQFNLNVPDLRRYALSGDGRSIAYTTNVGGTTTLWVQSFRDEGPRRLIDGNITAMPFWSPDGTKIGFFIDDAIKVISVTGGAPQAICDSPSSRDGTWSRNGVILFERDGSIYRVADRGGEPAVVLAAKPNTFYFAPSFLPDDDHFFVDVTTVSAPSDSARGSNFVVSLESGSAKKLFDVLGGAHFKFAEPGYTVYLANRKLMARRFDRKSLAVTGEAVVLHDAVASWDVSRAGSVAYRGRSVEAQDAITVVDRSGHELRSIGSAAPVWHLALAPDERHVALEIWDPKTGTTDIWKRDIETGRVTTRLTFTPKFEWMMTWSPDGSRIYFASNQKDNSDIYSMPASGGSPSLVFDGPVIQAPMDISRDGKYLLVFDTRHRSDNPDILAVPLRGGEPVAAVVTQFNEATARFAPDGKWIAYDSDKSGRREVYLQDFPAATRSIQVSAEGGHHPVWRADGRELYYTDGQKLFAVPIQQLSPEPRLGTATALFDVPPGGQRAFARYQYAPAKDGLEFYIIKEITPRSDSPVHIALEAMHAIEEDATR